MAPGTPPDDPVRGLGPSSTPPRMLRSGVPCIFLSLLSSVFGCFVAGRGLVPCRVHTPPSGRRLLRCGDCGAWTCSWRLVRRRVLLFAVVVSCSVPWCVLACAAACVPCLACVWRTLLARARGHSLSLAGPFGSMAGLVGAGLWPGARQCGVCTLGGGGGLVPLPSTSAPCPSVPFRWPALPAYPLRTCSVGLGWSVGLGGLTWCFFPAGRRGLGSFWGRVAGVVCRAACTVSWASWLLFTGVHALCVMLRVRCPGPLGSCSPVCALCVWCCAYGVLGPLAPVHRRARPVCGVACTVSWASWLLFTGVRALCVVLCARCPGSLGSCSPVCAFCVWCCVYGVLGLLAPVHRCARSVCGVVCTVSWASWLLFTGVHALCVVWRVRCPGPLGSCSPVCMLCVWCCVYGVLGLLAPVHRCARSVCGVACTVSWASWLLFTGVHVLCVVLRVRCPGPPGSCSPVCTPCVWCCGCGVLGRLLLFTGVHALCAVLCARCPGPLGSCAPVCLLWCAVSCVQCPGPLGSGSPVCTLCVRCRVCGLLGLLAPFCLCARVVCVVLRVWCPGTLCSCSPMLRCAAVCVVFGVRCCVCGVLGLPAPVHRCARPVCGVAWAVSWAAWLLFTGVPELCVAWCVRCPGQRGSRSPVCPCGVCCVACSVSWASWLLFTGVLFACSVCCVLCAVSPASWLLFTGVLGRCLAWCV